MKKLILASFVLVLLVMTSVSAEEITNETTTFAISDNDANGNYQVNNEIEINDNYLQNESNLLNLNSNNDNNPLESTNDEAIIKANPDNIIYVSPTGGGTGDTIDDPASWRYANSNIDNGGTIYFLDGIYKINTFLAKSDLTLQAVNQGNVIIDADHKNYAFRTRGAGTKIIGLTFINSDSYAAIYADYALTVINSTFINNTGRPRGGAIYSTSNLTVINSTFINNTAGSLGGAIFANRNVNVINSTFLNNNASSSSGGAIYSYATVNVTSSTFKNNSAYNQGGAIFAANIIDTNGIYENNIAEGSGGALRATSNITTINSTFTNNTSIRGSGSALYSQIKNTVINSTFNNNTGLVYGAVDSKVNEIYNSNFTNNTARQGGAVYGDINNISNSNFIDNSADYGGAIYSFETSNVENSNFVNNSAISGGAIYSNKNVNISKSKFDSNNATNTGGAVYSNSNQNITDSEFNNNYASDYGGAIYSFGELYLNNSELNANSVDRYGGSIYGINVTVENSNFSQNNAEFAGGAISAMNTNIINSNFNENNATNGGAIFSQDANVINSSFIGNTAFDGAAIGSDNLTIDNSYFEANEARTYGVVYTVNATIKNSEFKDNKALDNLQIYALNNLDLINTTIPDNEYEQANTTQDFVKEVTPEYMIQLESGLEGYCTQRTDYWTYGDVYVQDDLALLRNQITGEDVSEYLKILLYTNFENRTELASVVWIFTDGDFRNSDNEYVKKVLELYDSGFRVPSKGAALILENNTQVIIDFFSAGKAFSQNLFVFNITYNGDIYNLSIEKISLNNTVYLGENVMFDIIVSNTGDTVLHNVQVTESDYDDLLFVSWSSVTGNWAYKMENGKHMFILNELAINESCIFRVVFNTTSAGVKTNVVVVKSNETNETNTTNNTTVYSPNLNIKKITITPSVNIGEEVIFDVIVLNTGDCVLHGVRVVESDYDDLLFASWSSVTGNWVHNIENNKHVFTLDELAVNESCTFRVLFNATSAGVKNNVVVVSSNETNETNATNNTTVYHPNLSVVKITVTPSVNVGETVIFDVIVTNIGDCTLHNVQVTESDYDDLLFASWFNITGNWIHDIVNNRHRFILDELAVNESCTFRVLFNATSAGVKNNVVVVSSNETNETNATNNTTVYHPNLSVVKITVTPSVNVGETVIFDVIVTNTGDCVLHDVSVVESDYDDLLFASWSSINGNWIYTTENGKHVFKLSNLAVNESCTFRVLFNATSAGVKNNVVVVSSNETNETNATNNTTIHTPKMNIEKITLTPIVELGQLTSFEIIVSNTGDVILNNVSVIEYNFDGLVYDSFSNRIGNWSHDFINNYHVFKLNSNLGVNESASFIVNFKTIKVGNFTNVVIGFSNETGNITGKNVTEVINKTPDPKNNATINKTINKEAIPNDVNSLKTGNPLIFLIFGLLLGGLGHIRRRKD